MMTKREQYNLKFYILKSDNFPDLPYCESVDNQHGPLAFWLSLCGRINTEGVIRQLEPYALDNNYPDEFTFDCMSNFITVGPDHPGFVDIGYEDELIPIDDFITLSQEWLDFMNTMPKPPL